MTWVPMASDGDRQIVSHEPGVKGPKIWPINKKSGKRGALHQGHPTSRTQDKNSGINQAPTATVAIGLLI